MANETFTESLFTHLTPSMAASSHTKQAGLQLTLFTESFTADLTPGNTTQRSEPFLTNLTPSAV